MATAYTSLLGLALPVQGELQGTWGDTVNNSITSLLDTAVAGTTTLSSDADVTLTTTTGASNQARQAIILWTASGTVTRNITAPAQSKIYTVINKTGSTQSIVLRGVGPTTGVTIPAGAAGTFAWNGTDFVDISNYVSGNKIINGNLTVNGNTTLGDAAGDTITVNGATTFANVNPTLSAGTANGVGYLNGSKVLTTGSALTFDGTTLTANALSVTNGVTLSAGTANGVLYLNGSKVATSGSALTFDGNQVYIKPSSGFQPLKLAGSGGSIDTFFYTDTAYWGWGDAVALGGNAFAGHKTNNYLFWQISGSEQMRLTSTGLGIGTSSPGAKLEVYTAGTVNLRLNGSLVGGNVVDFYNYIPSVANNGFSIAVGGTLRAIIDASGNLGIGTSSPWQKLVLQGSANQSFMVAQDSTATYQAIYGADSAIGGSVLGSFSNHPVIFRTNNTERMRLDASGNLGLGVTPSAIGAGRYLQVLSTTSFGQQTDGSANVLCNAYESSGNAFSYIVSVAASRYVASINGHQWYIAPSGTAGNAISFTQAMTLDASGNLLLGTTSNLSSAFRQNIEGGRLGVASASDAYALYLRYNTSTLGFYIGSPSANTLSFSSSAGTEFARIDSSGNLGLGVTPSAWSQGRSIELSNIGYGVWNGGSSIYSIANTYFNSGFKYANTGEAASHYYQYQGAHVWSTAPSGTAGNAITFTQAMTLDASGNLGLGTTSPASSIGYSTITVSGSTGGQIAFATGGTGKQYIYSSSTDLNFYNSQTGNLIFYTNAAERARIDSSGNLLVGTTTTAGVGGITLQSISSGFALVNNNDAAATGYVFSSYRRSSTEIGSITQNGTTAVLFNTTSDRRLKNNIVPAPSASDVIDAIEIVSHDWKSAPDEHVTYGVIAQDLALVAPQAVLQGDDGDEIEKTWGVDYSKLVPMLIKEIQSLRARVAQLESK